MKGTEMGARGVTFIKDLECQARKCGSHPESIEEFLEQRPRKGRKSVRKRLSCGRSHLGQGALTHPPNSGEF